MEDEPAFAPIALIIALIMLAMPFIFFFNYIIHSLRMRSAFLPGLKSIYKPYLIHNFPYYMKLNDKDKLRFEKRVQQFINLKEFIPRGNLGIVTPEMKALIAGSAIQLTFGYNSIYFRHFRRILIYPDDYYSRITRKYHQGEVNLGGLIVISWSSLKEGFRSQTDGRHLGFHEMAHALRLINIVDNEEYDFYDRRIMQAFDIEAHHEIRKIVSGNDPKSLFRPSAAANLEEFFAIAVEAFFELPKEFRQHNSRLYDLLVKILRQDPAMVY